ncbi:Aste57867_2522 [Aphanomyces stellatus]|uniref:Aste57867_2522 protein n=1 Tax=Aphanomyces stellatus TaxID=120398 RepID=A0A485KDF4_9STRA|nr:hypothetical protein As57867_002515 [Aphanomyces stellatus]VFT79721.1 Aste57867_2522 [Aphanomyces stellatus]
MSIWLVDAYAPPRGPCVVVAREPSPTSRRRRAQCKIGSFETTHPRQHVSNAFQTRIRFPRAAFAFAACAAVEASRLVQVAVAAALMSLDLRDTTSGVVGAVFNVYAGLPFDVVKVRLQTQSPTSVPRYGGLVDCFAKTVQQESVRSLWKGAIPALSSAIVENAVLFSANGALKRVFFGAGESLSTLDEALVGSASGLFSAAAITPAEVIKCRLQTYAHAESMGIWRCTQSIVKESGVMGLTAGLGAVILRDVPFNFCFFGLYDYYTAKFMDLSGIDSRRELHPLMVLASGGCAGATSWTIVFPADVIKSRMQVDTRLTFQAAVRKVWRVQGILGFYRGWSSAVLGSFPADGCLFLGVEMTHRLFAHFESNV